MDYDPIKFRRLQSARLKTDKTCNERARRKRTKDADWLEEYFGCRDPQTLVRMMKRDPVGVIAVLWRVERDRTA